MGIWQTYFQKTSVAEYCRENRVNLKLILLVLIRFKLFEKVAILATILQ
jgi:hypothetical protein